MIRATRLSLYALAGSRLLQQAGWLAAAKIAQGTCSLLATFAVARHLGPVVFGQLSLAIAMASVVGSAAALGLEQIATREIAASTDRSPILVVLRRIRIAGALLGCAILAIAAWFPALHPESASNLLFALSLLPLVQIGDLSEWRLVAAERSHTVAIVALITSPVAAMARLLLVIFGFGAIAFAWVLVAEFALRSGLLWLACRRESISAAALPSNEFLRRTRWLLRDSIPLLMAGLAVFVYMRIDQFMIGAVLGSEQVGLYSAAVVMAEAPLVLPVLLLRAALPRLTQQSQIDPSETNHSFIRLMRHTFWIHVGGAVIATICAGPLIQLLYGSAYAPAAGVLRIQAWGAPFVALGVISGAWIVLKSDTRYALWRTLLGALVNIALNFALIPRFGIHGSACATVLAFAVTALASDALFPTARPLFRLKLRALGLVGASTP